MKLGAFSILFNDWSLEKTLDYFKANGLDAIEIGTGAYSRSNHLNAKEIIENEGKRREIRQMLEDRGMFISALGAHGNPIHPNEEIALLHHKQFEETVLAAEKLGVDTVLVLSGCPGGSPADETPNWVTTAWPDDFQGIIKYQWEDVLIPYWTKAVKFAKDHGVKVAVEPHPGFCVYNTETALRLHRAVGKGLGVNFDPSHFFWQGMDPCLAILELKDCIYHVHAKDSIVAGHRALLNGVLDYKPYRQMAERSWNFRTVGFGHSLEVWKGIMSALSMVGYDYVISIEHEDSLMDREEGFAKAAAFLQQVIIRKTPEVMWWEMRAEG
jgi:sugar phosphate isomerase/epimerase